MDHFEIWAGRKVIIAHRSDTQSPFQARLYVDADKGESLDLVSGATATLVCGKFKTETGLKRWAQRMLA